MPSRVCVFENRTIGGRFWGWVWDGRKITRRCFVRFTGAIVHEAQKGLGPSGRVHRIAAGGRVSPATAKFRPGPADTGTRTAAEPVVCVRLRNILCAHWSAKLLKFPCYLAATGEKRRDDEYNGRPVA